MTLSKDEKEKVQDMTVKLNSWHSYFSKLKNKVREFELGHHESEGLKRKNTHFAGDS